MWWLWNVWEDGVARALPPREVSEEVGSVSVDSSSPASRRVYDEGIEKGAGHWKGFRVERKCVQICFSRRAIGEHVLKLRERTQ